jgi:TetR/AcrR family transcriptional regulator, transcriptional repressor of aconitase
MGHPRLSGEQRKRAIVEAALPLFAAKGFEATTTKEVARAAGVSEPLLYKHFPSKEALYNQIQNFTCLETDPSIRKLKQLKPSTSTLVHLVYFLMRAMILEKPQGSISWDLRHRLMLQSFLSDGGYARIIYEERIAPYCLRIEKCLRAAATNGHVVRTLVSKENAAGFAIHVGSWIALTKLPPKAPAKYKSSPQELCDQATCFVLRGMGMTDAAIRRYYNPKALALFFDETNILS